MPYSKMKEAKLKMSLSILLFIKLREVKNMTEKEAKKFKYFSIKNARTLEGVCEDCKPYKDWFTYRRWKAQGEQIAKGQRGTQIKILVEREIKTENGEIKKERYPRTVTVFCRHQLA